MPMTTLEACESVVEEMRNEIEQLKQQRDELLEALSHFVNVCDNGDPLQFVNLIGESCQIAKLAIAKATPK